MRPLIFAITYLVNYVGLIKIARVKINLDNQEYSLYLNH